MDRDYCYVDFPSIIKNNGLNGFNKPSTKLYDVTFKKLTSGDVDKAVGLAKQLGVDYTVT